MAVGIMLLELFVAFLQAFIFAMLASVFIGQIREAAH
jgi:F-type H+-transporting ATPase subunit a